MIAALTSLKLEPKLLLCKAYMAFHLVQNLGRESKGVRGRDQKNL